MKLFFKIILLISAIYALPINNSVVQNIASNFNNNQFEIKNIDTYKIDEKIIFYIVHYDPRGFLLI